MSVSTKNHKGSAADICRLRGWTAGTRLVGDEGYGPTVIQITAVGERRFLAKQLGHAGVACRPYESSWVLYCRDWREAREDEVPVPLVAGQPCRTAKHGFRGVVVDGPDSAGFYRIDCGTHGYWLDQALASEEGTQA